MAMLETSKLPILRLIFMIPDPPQRSQVAACRLLQSVRPSPPAIAEVIPLRYRPVNFRRPAFTRYAISAENVFDQVVLIRSAAA
jgi:hypothetical protein